MQVLILAMVLGSIALDVAILAIAASFFSRKARGVAVQTARTYGVLAIFLISAASIASTLLMQYADLLVPCMLCWWQRIFMYPIGIVSLIALVRGRSISDISDYALAFAALGSAVALYQHLLQVLPAGALIPCDSSGDCATRLVFEFGFVTIPWMALSAFAMIFAIALLGRARQA